MFTDWFMKETSHGWDHNVFVTLSLDTSSKDRGELIMQWGSKPDGRKRTLHLESVSEVAVKKLNGKSYVWWLILAFGVFERGHNLIF